MMHLGGLNFLDFASLNNTFKINWLRPFLNDSESIWNTIPNYFFSKVGGLPFLLVCNVNYNFSKLPIKLSNFHKQVLLAWHLIYKHKFSPHRYFIWNNQDIRYKNKTIFFSDWFNNNILLVSQLVNSNSHLISSLPSLFDPLTLALSILILFDLSVFFLFIYKKNTFDPLSTAYLLSNC